MKRTKCCDDLLGLLSVVLETIPECFKDPGVHGRHQQGAPEFGRKLADPTLVMGVVEVPELPGTFEGCDVGNLCKHDLAADLSGIRDGAKEA